MKNENKIRLLISKSRAYQSAYHKAVEKGDETAAGKWKDGYRVIVEEINELKQKIS